MATVHFGRRLGPVGFSRTVAIKRLHPQFAKDPEFASMFVDEARLTARVRHPNVVPTLDVVATQGELFLVMDYVEGESLSRLVSTIRKQHAVISPRIVVAILAGALHGLHAAHEATDERGAPLDIVHRDVSPQNILVGVDGVARVLDFGVAKASSRIQTTREGQLKGKLAYMAPEQIGGTVSRQTDVYAAAIVLWEALTGHRLMYGENAGSVLTKVLSGVFDPPSRYVADLPPGLDQIVERGLARDPADRFATAREFAIALERCVDVASTSEVGEWVEAIAHDALSKRLEVLAEIEGSSVDHGETSPVSEASQRSSIAVVKSNHVLPASPRRAWIVAASGAALLAAVAVGAVTARRGPQPPPSVQPTYEPEPFSVTTVTSAPVATLVESTTELPRIAPPAARHAPHVTTTTPPKDCNLPYTLNVKGQKIWKVECFP